LRPETGEYGAVALIVDYWWLFPIAVFCAVGVFMLGGM
jgi:hypothetical protein